MQELSAYIDAASDFDAPVSSSQPIDPTTGKYLGGTIVTIGRSGGITVNDFKASVSLEFRAYAGSAGVAHGMANLIADLVDDWYEQTAMNIMGSPSVDAITDEGDETGQYVSSVVVTIAYLEA